jgi:hypothetical protein
VHLLPCSVANQFIGGGPSFAIVAPISAVHVHSNESWASSAHKLPCSVRDELRCGGFRRLTASQNWWWGGPSVHIVA